jgi:hypothetical protein
MTDPLERTYGPPAAWPAELLELRERALAEALGWEPPTGAVARFTERRAEAAGRRRRCRP